MYLVVLPLRLGQKESDGAPSDELTPTDLESRGYLVEVCDEFVVQLVR